MTSSCTTHTTLTLTLCCCTHTRTQTKGELSDERKAKVDAAQQTFAKLWQNAATFADLVDDALPELPPDVVKADDVMNINVYSHDSEVGVAARAAARRRQGR